MYGDTEVMRRHAGRLREQGGDIRLLADSLVSQVESLRWSGRAAESLRERVRERAGRLREVASRHESAADSLEAHGQEVDQLKDAIATAERRALGLQAEARARAARRVTDDTAGGTVTLDPDAGGDRAEWTLTGFEPPPSGHRDWLGVSLPGL
jgi:septal ring factor EnvC (AmiA/AmiB activator)